MKKDIRRPMIEVWIMARTGVLEAVLSRVLLRVQTAETRPESVHMGLHRLVNDLRVLSEST
jgi:hypothetical protein